MGVSDSAASASRNAVQAVTAEPYSRLYWKFVDEFTGVYDDDVLFAWYVRLLVIADGAFPMAATLPRRIDDETISALRDAELIELCGVDRYRIRGMAAERARRSDVGRAGGLASGRSRAQRTIVERSSNDRRTTQRTKSNLAKPSQAKPSQAEGAGAPRAGAAAHTSARAREASDDSTTEISDSDRLRLLADELTQRHYSLSLHSAIGQKVLHEQLSNHGFAKVESAWRTVAKQVSRPTIRQLVFGADDILNPLVRVDKDAARDEQARTDFDRRVERTRKLLAQQRGETL